MKCPKCETENPNDAQLCCNCGESLQSVTDALNSNVKTSRLAVASFVLALLCFLTCFITAIPAVLCGLFGLLRIESSKGQLKGKGLAITGIVIPGISIVVVPLLMAILMPALARVRTLAQETVCATNMSELGNAAFIYANDNNNTLPTPSKWCDLLIENTDVSEELFHCSGASEGLCNYAINKNIENIGADTPPDIVLLFETSPGWNQSGGPEILTTDNHKGEGCNVMYTDGRVEFVRKKDIHKLKWTDD